MNQRIEELLQVIRENACEDNLQSVAQDCVDEISQLRDAFDAVAPLLQIIEANPHADFGMPGPIVHFVEKYFRCGYEDLLTASVRRSPTTHNTWMLNRVINGVDGDEKEYFLGYLREVPSNLRSDARTIQIAEEFLAAHGQQ